MDVSVIIVNYNTKDLTKSCIDSIIEQTKGVSFEIILVDNASTDGSVELFENDDRVIFIKNNTNIGFGRANNVGYRRAQGKYLFLLNSDTVLQNNAIALFVNAMAKIDKPACLGTTLINGSGEFCTSYGTFPTVFHEFKARGILHFFFGKKRKKLERPKLTENQFLEVDYVVGADLFLEKALADKYGLFDEDFFLYYEETEMQYRYKKSGFHNYIFSDPQIVHFGGESGYKRFSLKKGAIVLRSSLLFIKKTNSSLVYWFYRFMAIPLNLNFLFRFSAPWKDRLSYFKILFTSL